MSHGAHFGLEEDEHLKIAQQAADALDERYSFYTELSREELEEAARDRAMPLDLLRLAASRGRMHYHLSHLSPSHPERANLEARKDLADNWLDTLHTILERRIAENFR